jgi:hypothetical protein
MLARGLVRYETLVYEQAEKDIDKTEIGTELQHRYVLQVEG